MPDVDQSAPSSEEAFATLSQLAEVFLRSGPRRSDDAIVSDAKADPRRVATVLVDDTGRIQGFDSEAERLLGRNAREIVNSSAQAVLGQLPTDGDQVASVLHLHNGTDLSVWMNRAELTLGGKAYAVITLRENTITDRERTELRYRHLVEQIPAVVFTAALDGGLYDIYVGPQIEDLLGYSQTEWASNPVLWYQRLHVDDRSKLDKEFARGCLTGGPFRAECRFLTREDKIVWVHGEARLIKDDLGLPLLLQGVAFDITETKQAEEVARASLKEKETLLKEIHHRVKNNLQVTSSLLRLQADGVEDESAKRALREGQGRIGSMALVHELLYRSKDLSEVDLGQYVRDLLQQLVRLHAVAPSRVRVESKLDLVPIAIDLAVPAGLILNELVSNALKHAFPSGRQGIIYIELRADNEFDELIVRDNGVGLPDMLDFDKSSTLGLRLIRTLADQIDGKLQIRSNGGTEIRLRIPRQRGERL